MRELFCGSLQIFIGAKWTSSKSLPLCWKEVEVAWNQIGTLGWMDKVLQTKAGNNTWAINI